jgi:hypothetical protein
MRTIDLNTGLDVTYTESQAKEIEKIEKLLETKYREALLRSWKNPGRETWLAIEGRQARVKSLKVSSVGGGHYYASYVFFSWEPRNLDAVRVALARIHARETGEPAGAIYTIGRHGVMFEVW